MSHVGVPAHSSRAAMLARLRSRLEPAQAILAAILVSRSRSSR